MSQNLTQQQLENLHHQMMQGCSADLDDHYNVTIQLIEIIRDQQHEIDELRKQLENETQKEKETN